MSDYSGIAALIVALTAAISGFVGGLVSVYRWIRKTAREDGRREAVQSQATSTIKAKNEELATTYERLRQCEQRAEALEQRNTHLWELVQGLRSQRESSS